MRIAHGQWEPLPSHRRHAARLGRMGRDKSSIGQNFLPLLADVDQVAPIGSIAMEKHDQLAGRAGFWRKAGSIKFYSHASVCETLAVRRQACDG